MPIETSAGPDDAEVPRQAVRRWYEAEGSKDSPFIPPEWPEAWWFCLVAMYPDMRTWVAHQPYAPEAVIRHLAAAGDWRVRHRVAMKRNLPADLFSILAADPEPLVRMAIAGNAKAPLALVQELAADPQDDVAQTATLQLERRRAADQRAAAKRPAAGG